MTPFGFGPDQNADENSDGSEKFAAMLEEMQKQMKEQFEKLGMNPAGFINAAQMSSEPLPRKTVRDTAKKFVSSQGSLPIGNSDTSVVAQASSIAQLWLNEATYFPALSSATKTLSRNDWVDETLEGWHTTIEPLALGLSEAISGLLRDAQERDSSDGEDAQFPIPVETIASLLRTFIGTLIATQLGQSIGALATSVTGAHDVGLPLTEPVIASLVPENIAQWALDLEIPKSEVTLFHALREEAVARLFHSNPWLVSYMRTAISDYGKGIRIDIDEIQRHAQEAMESGSIDPNNPESLSIAIGEGFFTPEESPTQREALDKLETVLALIDGWTDEVTTLAVDNRLPSISALRETFRRRRATSAPSAQLFKSLFGLEVSPRLTREASVFWSSVREKNGIDARDRMWSSLLPTADDLHDPESFMKSTQVPDDLSSL